MTAMRRGGRASVVPQHNIPTLPSPWRIRNDDVPVTLVQRLWCDPPHFLFSLIRPRSACRVERRTLTCGVRTEEEGWAGVGPRSFGGEKER